MEWFALFIPLVAGAVLYWKLPHKVVWWEAVLPMLPALILIPALREMAVHVRTHDVERWGGWVTRAIYYEPWDEYIHQTCTREVPDGTDSQGRAKTKTETYDCSYVSYHSAQWQVRESNGIERSISKADFEWLAQRFRNRVFRDQHRFYHSIDGDAYETTWQGDEPSFQPMFTEHAFVNKILVTKGVLGFPDVPNPAELGLYEFPPLQNHFVDPAVLGTAPGAAEADQILQRANARLGSHKQVRLWLLLFHDKPLKTGLDQQNYWKGGNKNELVVCLGLSNQNQVQWCHPFCWSPDGNTSNDTLKIHIRDYATRMKSADLPALSRFIVQETAKLFERKSFKEFDFLHIECPGWAIVVIYLLTIGATGVVAMLVVNNEIEPQQAFRAHVRR